MRQEDKGLPKVEQLAIFFQRYKFSGVLAVLAVVFSPYAVEWLAEVQKNAINRAIEHRLQNIEKQILESRAMASTSHMKTLVSSKDFNILVRHRVRSQTLDKLREIKTVWLVADKKSDVGKARLWVKVKNILERNSNIYINELNNYTHPIVGDVGSYVDKTFPIAKNTKRKYRPKYSFMSAVYDIVIRDNNQDADLMIENLSGYMKSVQARYFSDQFKILKKIEEDNKL